MSNEQGLTPYETREILFYKTDNGEVRVEILLFQENLWLTQAKMAELFEVQKAAISKHLKNIFESGELSEDAVVSKMETTAADGKRYKTNYYNLDVIIAMGYRVNSQKAMSFICCRCCSFNWQRKLGLNSVYTRSGQNSTPNSNATNLHSSQKRCCSFCISSSNASPTFQVQKSIFHQMTKPIQVTVILPLLLAISFSRNDDIHSSISGISNDLIGVIPTIGQ